MSSTYLAPYRIISEGINEARSSDGAPVRPSWLWQRLAGLYGRSTQYVRSWGRNPDRETHGTGEHSPIDQFERLLAFFSVHNRTAAILMCERARFELERLGAMSEGNIPNLDDIEMKLSQHVVRLRSARFNGDPNEIAKALAGFKALAEDGLKAVRNSEVARSQFVPEISKARQAGLMALGKARM